MKVVDQLGALGAEEVAIHGGEAYLRKDWLEIVRAVRERGMRCSMVTGGRGLTPSVAKQAAQAGLGPVSVSIDGTAEVHDALRGLRGSHESALKALGNLSNEGIAVACNTQINRRNLNQLPAIGELLLPFHVYAWQVQMMVPMGRAAEQDELWLQPYETLELLPRVAEIRQWGDEHSVEICAGDNIGYYGPHEAVIRKHKKTKDHWTGCGAGVGVIGLEAHGDVKGCSIQGSAEFTAGNVKEHALADLWHSAPELTRMRKGGTAQGELWGFCATCYYAPDCKGGCPWTAASVMGRRGNNPYCHHRALELEKAGLRERLVRNGTALLTHRGTPSLELVQERIQ
jgi:radical SAM protein with 4Fe4S-binding SPASM domain